MADLEMVFLGLIVVFALAAIEERYVDVAVRACCGCIVVAIMGITLKLLHLEITSNATNFLALDAGALLGIVLTDMFKRRFPPDRRVGKRFHS